jgi:hypothetical protein
MRARGLERPADPDRATTDTNGSSIAALAAPNSARAVSKVEAA